MEDLCTCAQYSRFRLGDFCRRPPSHGTGKGEAGGGPTPGLEASGRGAHGRGAESRWPQCVFSLSFFFPWRHEWLLRGGVHPSQWVLYIGAVVPTGTRLPCVCNGVRSANGGLHLQPRLGVGNSLRMQPSSYSMPCMGVVNMATGCAVCVGSPAGRARGLLAFCNRVLRLCKVTGVWAVILVQNGVAPCFATRLAAVCWRPVFGEASIVAE